MSALGLIAAVQLLTVGTAPSAPSAPSAAQVRSAFLHAWQGYRRYAWGHDDLDPLSRRPHDWYAFTVAFKGVFLEGLEVAFIVVTFGGSQHNVGLASLGAAAALVIVLAAGLIVHAPLSRVPENTLKFGVGVMLTSFGMFWAGEGAGVAWPAGDISILGLVAFALVMSSLLVRVLRRTTLPIHLGVAEA